MEMEVSAENVMIELNSDIKQTDEEDDEKCNVEIKNNDATNYSNNTLNVDNTICNLYVNNIEDKHIESETNAEKYPESEINIDQPVCTNKNNENTEITMDKNNSEHTIHDTIETKQISIKNTFIINKNEDYNNINRSLSSQSSKMEKDNVENICSNKENDNVNENFDKVNHLEIQVSNSFLNTGLGMIAAEYNTSSTESEDEKSSDSVEFVEHNENEAEIYGHRSVSYVISSDSDLDSTSDSSDIEIVKISKRNEIFADMDGNEEDNEINNRPREPIRAKGELLLEDLPPIQDLHITVPEQECIELGKIHSIVDQLVLVDCIQGTAKLDLDTVLFLEKGNKVLGQVFDVIGQVSNPLYCVRFNSNKDIKEKNIEIGQTVFIAPRTEHTHFLILSNLMSIRGSDASWENDIEPPEAHLDYSDDEEERIAKRSIRNRKQRLENGFESRKEEVAKKPQPYRPQHRNVSPHQEQPTFQYNSVNSSWHVNYSQSSNLLPNPYSQQFSTGNMLNASPSYNNTSSNSRNFEQSSPSINRTEHFTSPNQNSPFSSNLQLSPYNFGFSHTQYNISSPIINQNVPSSTFRIPNQHNNFQEMPPNYNNNLWKYDRQHH